VLQRMLVEGKAEKCENRDIRAQDMS
jgi:hypothetical protein